MTDQPFISVIIPVWNSPDLLAKCLAALAVQSYPRERYEVLVVDNGSTDSTAAVARNYPFVTLLSEPVPGAYLYRWYIDPELREEEERLIAIGGLPAVGRRFIATRR